MFHIDNRSRVPIHQQLQAQIVREFALWADTPVCDAERMDNFYRSSSSPF